MGGMLAARTKKRCTPDRLSLPQWYMRQRWYDPTLQRFISRDPIGLQGGANLWSTRPVSATTNRAYWLPGPLSRESMVARLQEAKQVELEILEVERRIKNLGRYGNIDGKHL